MVWRGPWPGSDNAGNGRDSYTWRLNEMRVSRRNLIAGGIAAMVFGGNTGGFTDSILAGQGSLARPFIKSPNFLAGVRGWAIYKNGNVEFNNGIFRGNLQVGSATGPGILSQNNPNIPVTLINPEIPAPPPNPTS